MNKKWLTGVAGSMAAAVLAAGCSGDGGSAAPGVTDAGKSTVATVDTTSVTSSAPVTTEAPAVGTPWPALVVDGEAFKLSDLCAALTDAVHLINPDVEANGEYLTTDVFRALKEPDGMVLDKWDSSTSIETWPFAEGSVSCDYVVDIDSSPTVVSVVVASDDLVRVALQDPSATAAGHAALFHDPAGNRDSFTGTTNNGSDFEAWVDGRGNLVVVSGPTAISMSICPDGAACGEAAEAAAFAVRELIDGGGTPVELVDEFATGEVLADIGGSQVDVCAAFEEVVRVTAPATLWQPAFALTDSGEFMGESCVIAAIDTDETPNVVRLGVFTLENSPIGMIESGNAEATVIDGLGDKAYHLAAFPAVVVQIGETVVMVRNADGGSMPGSEVAIAQGLVAAITA